MINNEWYIQAMLPPLRTHSKVDILTQVNRSGCSKMKYRMLVQSNPLIIFNLYQLTISLFFWPLKIWTFSQCSKRYHIEITLKKNIYPGNVFIAPFQFVDVKQFHRDILEERAYQDAPYLWKSIGLTIGLDEIRSLLFYISVYVHIYLGCLSKSMMKECSLRLIL